MKKHSSVFLSQFLVSHRRILFFLMLAVGIGCGLLIPRVSVITDMTHYLPKTSPMKQGIDVLTAEFPDLEIDNTIRVMFTGLPEEEKRPMADALSGIEFVKSVAYYEKDPLCEDGTHSLYTLRIPYDYSTPQMHSVRRALDTSFKNGYDMIYSVDDPSGASDLPLWLIGLAVAFVVLILLIMSASWIEPVFFLFTIGIAIVINTGSAFFFGRISNASWSIGAILQLVLSMDYSVMLMSRYREEKKAAVHAGPEAAMACAIRDSFPAISSSSFTTIAGLLALAFMRFRIGADLGFMLAKGVLCSMICIYTVLPALILRFDSLIERTPKKIPKPKTTALALFQYRLRRPLLVLIAALFVLTLIIKGKTDITYTVSKKGKIDSVFPQQNTIILLYPTAGEEQAAKLAAALEQNPAVSKVNAWSTTLGKSFTTDDLNEVLPSLASQMHLTVPEEAISLLFLSSGKTSMTPAEMLDTAGQLLKSNPLFVKLLGEKTISVLEDASSMMDDAERLLRGKNYSLMQISASLPGESEETFAFLETLGADAAASFSEPYDLIGNSPMALEMSETFHGELNFVTILTAVIIFLVVFFTFRRLAVPALLVPMIQTAVFLTMVIINLQGSGIYFLAILVVQGILMGATIDYAILYTSYYRELRASMDISDALKSAYDRSAGTILTTGSIMILVTFVLGYAFSNPAIRQICHTISTGALCAVCLILFVLPGALAALDSFVLRKPHSS